MVNLQSLFSPRHMLMLSVALNVSLVLKIIRQRKNIREKVSRISMEKPKDAQIAEESETEEASSIQNMHPTPSPLAVNGGDADDGRNVINLDHGDPTMYERYWQEMGDKTTMVIPGWQFTSYFSDAGNLCWFLEPELAKEIARLHKVVGNAVTEGCHIVVGTGSSQLFQAALYAFTADDASEPFSVVSAAPYYSSYPAATDCLKSGLYKWGGDACNFTKTGPYIELVTSPNNPDGFVRQSVVNRSGGILVHDLAYYWPQYTPITSAADYELMLFTVSKSTGHAGMRIGWALVKDQSIAKKMVKYIELSTIGVSKDSQLRAAKVMKVVSDSCGTSTRPRENFFGYCHHLMAERWKLLREAVKQSGIFSLPEFEPGFCNFFQCLFEPLPAFAWLKGEGRIEDCESFLKSHNIWTRSGRHFGVSPSYVRVSMLDRDRTFVCFVKRLSQIHLG